MERDLVAFAGAGLQVVASGIVTAPPDGSIRDGYAFVAHLQAFGNPDLKRIVLEAIAPVWSEWQRSRLPRIVAREHISAMPEILEACRVEPARIADFIASLEAGAPDGRAAAYRLTSMIMRRATEAGAFDDTGISSQLTFFFVERLLAGLLADHAVVTDLKMPIAGYFARYAREQAAVASGSRDDRPFGDDVLSGWQPGRAEARAVD